MTLKNKICVDCGGACSRTRCRSCANKGKNNPAYMKQHRLGIKHTEEAKKKMVETRRKNGNLGKMTYSMKKKISKNNARFWLGKKIPKEVIRKGVETRKKNGTLTPTKEQREKQSLALRGEKSHLWRGGKTKRNRIIRYGMEGRGWRRKVFERDKFTCQNNGCEFCSNVRGANGRLQAHHVKKLSKFPELAHNLDNGTTYCQDYHLGVIHNFKKLIVGGNKNFQSL